MHASSSTAQLDCPPLLTRVPIFSLAVVSFASITMSMMALMKTLDVFGRERIVVAREHARGRYDAMEYVLAKLITELPLDAACKCKA